MKLLSTSLLFLFSAAISLADVALYNGVQVVKTTSLSGTRTVVERFIEVVDLENAQIVVITLGAANGKKTFSIAPPANVILTEVQDSRGAKRKSTVLAQASTTTDGATGITTVTSFLQMGGNLQVSIKTDEKIGLPRNMQGSALLVATAGVDVGGDIPAEHVDIKSTLVLQDALSRLSNDADDTLAAAVDRMKASLLAKGFIDADA